MVRTYQIVVEIRRRQRRCVDRADCAAAGGQRQCAAVRDERDQPHYSVDVYGEICWSCKVSIQV